MRTFFPDYEAAAHTLFWRWIRDMMNALSPLVASIQSVEMDEVSRHESAVGIGEGSQSAAMVIHGTATVQLAAQVEGDPQGWALLVLDTAETSLQSLVPQLLQQFHEVTSRTGQVLDAKGRGLNYDTIMDMLEMIEFDIDERGRPSGINAVVSPDQARELAKLPPPTPAQLERLQAIVAKRREVLNARRRVRRLDRHSH